MSIRVASAVCACGRRPSPPSEPLADRMTLTRWRALAVSFAGGAAAALAMPPLHWLPLAVVGLTLFVWLWRAAPDWRGAAARGWAWGIGHFAVGSYWIVEAFFVPPADFKVLGPPMIAGLAVVLGLYVGAAAGAAKWLVTRWPRLATRGRSLLVLAIAWTLAEWLRGHLFTGYPWNPLAHVWAFSPPLMQGVALVGVFGLGTVSFLVLAAPAAGWKPTAAAVIGVAAAALLGLQVMDDRPVSGADTAAAPMIRIVQPNVPQALKWLPEYRAEQFGQLLRMSREPGFEALAAVVWPETALPFVLEPGSPALPVLAEAAPPKGYLLTGALRADGGRIWNSLLAVDYGGRIVGHYDKVHLVPFGEYIPFHRELPDLSGRIGRGSFEVGEGMAGVSLSGLPVFSPVICYEAIFPGAVTGPGERPRWLLNITNDAWFGVSSGPYQHLVSARMRAVEEGLPMVRAANTGVSAVIDAYGRVLALLDMQRQGIIDHRLPPARPATFYSRFGDVALLVLVGLLGLASVAKMPRFTASLP